MNRLPINNITTELKTCRYLSIKDTIDNLKLDDTQMSNIFNECFVNITNKIIKQFHDYQISLSNLYVAVLKTLCIYDQ